MTTQHGEQLAREPRSPGSPGSAPEPTSGFHPVNLTHLVMGVVFAAFAGIWAAVTGGWLPVDDLRWVLPVPWLLAGSAGLLAATLNSRRRRHRGPDHGRTASEPEPLDALLADEEE